MKRTILNIEGMTCSACSNGLEKYLNKQRGITSRVNLVMATATVDYDESVVSLDDIERFVMEAGFELSGEVGKDNSTGREFYLLVIFAFFSAYAMYVGMGHMIGLPVPQIMNGMIHPRIYTATLLVLASLALLWGSDILTNGIKNIVHKMPNMDSLVGVGVLVNFVFSLYNAYHIFMGEGDLNKIFFESVIMIVLFVKIGRYVDKRNKAKAVDTIKNLVTLTPERATVLVAGKEITKVINDIDRGDVVIARPGEKIAVDGKILKGETHTDESFLTGEANPVRKKVGDMCLAGSINYDGYIEYEAVNIGKNSSVSHIVDLVVEATNTKAPIARIADEISGYFVPFIFVVATLSGMLNFAFTKDLTQCIESLVTVLVVACPCALGLATPLAMVVAIGTASKLGFVVKSSESIEGLNKIDTIIFDKTGTLTKGRLSLVDMKTLKSANKIDHIKVLQALEAKSNHPLAKGICLDAADLDEVEDFKEVAGYGVNGKVSGKMYYAGSRKYLNKCKVKNEFLSVEEEYIRKGESIVYLWDEDEVLAIVGLKDEVKSSMKDTVKALRNLGKRVVVLSGDNEGTAKMVSEYLGIDEYYSGVSPQGKLEKIADLNVDNNAMMVGDGINDSPALKKASIGISVSNGTDISNDASDVIMLADEMKRLLDLFDLARRTMTIIKENLFWALFYNVCMIPLATGLLPLKLNPMIASFAMIISSVTVVLNSLRLKR